MASPDMAYVYGKPDDRALLDGLESAPHELHIEGSKMAIIALAFCLFPCAVLPLGAPLLEVWPILKLLFALFLVVQIYSAWNRMHGRLDGGHPFPASHLGHACDDPRHDAAGFPTLFVISHPDDECMFFAPALAYFSMIGPVHILCLSNGNHRGLGRRRARELIRACHELGIGEFQVMILDDPKLQDGPENAWDPEYIRAIVQKTLIDRRILRVVSFDAGGITSHPNHVATSHGVRQLLASYEHWPGRRQPNVYLLMSPGEPRWLRKLVFCMFWNTSMTLLSFTLARTFGGVRPSHVATILSWRPEQARRAMRHHASQWVWYRKLYLVFSRYTYLNELVFVNPNS